MRKRGKRGIVHIVKNVTKKKKKYRTFEQKKNEKTVKKGER